MRCAFLTMEETDGWAIDADLAFAPLAELGWQCEWLPWTRDGVDWDRFEAVYIAATWDYPDDPERFLEVLHSIERSSATLVNPFELIRWNIPKTYLRDIEARGADIVPSRWYERFADCDLDAEFVAFDAVRLILKPVVSTNAHNTFPLERDVDASTRETIAQVFADRPFVVQPFMAAIQTEGEYSLFYIGGTLSHAIRKRPKADDFRVQEEYGADIRLVDVDAALRRAADDVMAMVEPEPLYARCDFVRDAAGTYRVMELELIEPSLYLRMDADAPARFAHALDTHVRRLRGSSQ